MEITLTKEEILEMFYHALCNAVGTGYMDGYGITLEYKKEDYKDAKRNLLNKGKTELSYEDVLMQILKDGKTLTFTDVEGEGEMTRTINLNDVYERLPLAPAQDLIDMKEENDDASTADNILQTVFFKEIIFG